MPNDRRRRVQVVARTTADAARRLDGQGGMPELIDAPFDWIAYGHDGSSRTLGSEGRRLPVAARSTACGHESTATRLQQSTPLSSEGKRGCRVLQPLFARQRRSAQDGADLVVCRDLARRLCCQYWSYAF